MHGKYQGNTKLKNTVRARCTTASIRMLIWGKDHYHRKGGLVKRDNPSGLNLCISRRNHTAHTAWTIENNFNDNTYRTMVQAVEEIIMIIQCYMFDSSAFSNQQRNWSWITVGDRTVALNIIARCSITQTPTGQSKVWWWHARKMVVIFSSEFKFTLIWQVSWFMN